MIEENNWTINQIWKRKIEFFWFSICNYGVIPSSLKTRMSIMKVPDKTLDKMLEIMKSGREFTVEEMNAIWNETEAEQIKKHVADNSVRLV